MMAAKDVKMATDNLSCPVCYQWLVWSVWSGLVCKLGTTGIQNILECQPLDKWSPRTIYAVINGPPDCLCPDHWCCDRPLSTAE